MANEKNLVPFTGADDPRRSNGRPKGIPNAATRYQRILSLITKTTNPVTGKTEEFTQAELMDLKIMAKALKGDLNAYKEIMNRLEGSPAQSIDHTTKGKELPTPILGGASVPTHNGNQKADETKQEN